MAKLYSVTRSLAPYDTDDLVAHELEYVAAKRIADSIKDGIVSLFPSSDLEV